MKVFNHGESRPMKYSLMHRVLDAAMSQFLNFFWVNLDFFRRVRFHL